MFISANVRIFYELTKLGSFSVFLYICPKMCSILFNEMKKRVLYILLYLNEYYPLKKKKRNYKLKNTKKK